MVACLRLFLVLLLVLLQLVAPLVHAHAGGPDSQFGIHLKGLESLTLAQHDTVVSSQQHAMIADSAMIEVDSGIKRLKTRWIPFNIGLLAATLIVLSPPTTAICLSTDTPTPHPTAPPGLQQHPSRAPPQPL